MPWVDGPNKVAHYIDDNNISLCRYTMEDYLGNKKFTKEKCTICVRIIEFLCDSGSDAASILYRLEKFKQGDLRDKSYRLEKEIEEKTKELKRLKKQKAWVDKRLENGKTRKDIQREIRQKTLDYVME